MKQMVCSVCSYTYDEAKGIPEAGIAPGTRWEDLPADWKCPWCGASKDAFREKKDPSAEKTTENLLSEASCGERVVRNGAEHHLF